LALFSTAANPKSQILNPKSVAQIQNPKSYLASSPSARAAVAAVKAGNDIALLPSSIDGAYNGLLEAVRTGELSEAQIDASVLKILRAKASVGLHRARLVDLEALPRLVNSPENQAVGQHIADAAVTLVREYSPTLASSSSSPKNGDDKGGATPTSGSTDPGGKSSNKEEAAPWSWQLPRVPGFPCRIDPETFACIRPGTAEGPNAYTRVVETHNRIVAVVFTDDVRTEAGRGFERELRARVPDANVMFIDESVAAFSADAVLATMAPAERVIVAVYASPQPGRFVGRTTAGTALRPKQAALLQTMLQRTGDHAVVVAMGNPYLASDFPDVPTYLCTFSTMPVSEIAAVKALFGEIPIGGRLPVTIPGFAERGMGIDKAEQK
jgi:beta-N-acetylhexosaminidase